MKRYLSTVGLLFFPVMLVHAEAADSSRRYGYMEKHFSVLASYNGCRYQFAEIGFAMNSYGSMHHPMATACFVSCEARVTDMKVIGPKIGGWIGGGAGGMAMGANLVCYTDFDRSSLRFRPEIGMGFDRWKVVYGYNARITGKDFEGINRNNLAIAWLFSLKKRGETVYPAPVKP